MATFIRFETRIRDEQHCRPLGIFRAGSRSCRSTANREALGDAFHWFNCCLPLPPADTIDPRAVFWFRGQSEAVRKALRIASIFRREGVRVWKRRTKTPGEIVYRDDFQIAAIPRLYR